MGLLFTPMLSWTSAKIKLASQAEKAIISITKYQHKFGHLLLNETFKLFDAIVKPILCYASCIWEQSIVRSLNQFKVNSAKNF